MWSRPGFTLPGPGLSAPGGPVVFAKYCHPATRAPLWPGVPDPKPSPLHRRERAIKQTVAASAGAKAFSVACTLIQVPIALHYLGTEAYGFWVTLVSVVLILNYVDFGLGVGMQHTMARSYGGDDMEAMRRVFWTGAAVLVVLGLILLAIGLPVAFFVHWADILKIKDPALRSETGAGLAVAIAAFVVGLPFNAVARLAAAAQRGWIHAGWIAAGSALSLGLVAAAAHGKWGFLWFLAASLVVPILQGIGLFVHLLKVLNWDLAPTAFAPVAQLRLMLRSSLLFAVPQVGLALVQSCPALAISFAAGSSAVTGYTLLMRLFSPFQQGQNLLLTPVWPAYTEAHARSDHAWVVRTFWRTMAALGLLAAGIGAAAWQSPALLRLWVGPTAAFMDRRLAALAAAWCLLQMAAQPFIYYLIGVGKLRRLAWAASPGLLISAVALFWGFGKGTVEGVLEAGTAGLALALLPPVIWQTIRTLRSHEGRDPHP
jgi:O-antigen/teichoic acid export membrane protein